MHVREGLSGIFCVVSACAFVRRRLVVHLLFSLTLLPAAAQDFQPMPPAGVWVTDERNLYLVDPDSNAITRSISLPYEAKSLAVNPSDGGVWLLAGHILLRYNSTASLIQQLDMRSVSGRLADPKYLLYNPHDASLWITAEKSLVHLDAAARLIGESSFDKQIRAITLDLDDSLWLLAGRELLHLSASGSTLLTLNIGSQMGDPRYLALDRLGNRLWVADKKQVLCFDAENPSRSILRILPAAAPAGGADGDSGAIETLGVHPVFGTLWAANRQNLWIYDREGQLLKQATIASYDLGKIERLAFDSARYSLWLGGEKALGRFQSNGLFVTRIPLPHELEDVDASPFRLAPTLSQLAPADGTKTNNPFVSLRYGLGADCTGATCLLDPDYTRSFRLDASLNGHPVGSQFTLTPDEATYTPSTRLPEGMNTVFIRATDRYGHASERLTSHFTVDTIPPRFLSISPADGSVVNVAAVAIAGQVDDPTTSVQLMDDTGGMRGMAGAQFDFSVILKPGWNAFTLVARDAAGNSASTPMRIYFTQLDAVITSFTPDAMVKTDSLALSGTYTGPENTGITINGLVAITDGTKFYVNNLPLMPGLNTLTIVITGPDGKSVTKTITVTSNGSSLFQVRVDPQGGVVPLKATFKVSNNSGQPIKRISVDFDGNGTTDFTTTDLSAPIQYNYTSPGVYLATLNVTDDSGTTDSQTLAIVAQDPQQRDRFFTSLWSGMNDALVRSDLPTASRYLNEGARQRYLPVFETLKTNMSAIISSYSPLRRVSISSEIGEYATVRNYNGKNHLYLIYFLQDADGVWRLDAM